MPNIFEPSPGLVTWGVSSVLRWSPSDHVSVFLFRVWVWHGMAWHGMACVAL